MVTQQPYVPPYGAGGYVAVKPPNYMVLNAFAAFCCCLLCGLMGLYMGSQVRAVIICIHGSTVEVHQCRSINYTKYCIAGNFRGVKKFVQLEKRWFSCVKISFSLVACTAFLRFGKPRLRYNFVGDQLDHKSNEYFTPRKLPAIR